VNRRCSTIAAAGALALAACGTKPPTTTPPAIRPSILLVTLDTTRADSIGPGAAVSTPAFNALAARGLQFTRAYATATETLPSHASMLTGLYPAGHTVHENARVVPSSFPLVAEALKGAGYHTEAVVSSFTLARRFGLARGFVEYDDTLPNGGVERSARETTDVALKRLAQAPRQPLFFWVHYFDPHFPYAPPEPYRSQYAKAPYLGEVAAMDEQLGRLVAAFEQRTDGLTAIAVAGDHGEGLGEHGEAFHGNLLYEPTVRVPLVMIGDGITPGTSDSPVSTRRIFHTLLDWAGIARDNSLRNTSPAENDVVLGEAMKPFLEYGWQPQVMAIQGTKKAILSGRIETYDLRSDPKEARDLGPGSPPAELRDYPMPGRAARAPDTISAADRQRLATLGYVSGGAAPVTRSDSPRAADMTMLFPLLDRASTLFVNERYAEVVPVLNAILAKDPRNLDATLRLATAYSSLGRTAQADAVFDRAAAFAPASDDVRLYRALHLARGPQWTRAVPLLEQALITMPDRLPALEALADLRERERRPKDALALRLRVGKLRELTGSELVRIGLLAMSVEDTQAAITAFEQARTVEGGRFQHDLELGVLYLAGRRLADARTALDRVPPSHRAYPMALFKRAQVSVLLNEPDSAARIAAARARADATTRELIARETLFRKASRK
jgi:choline-sulfatase